MKQFVVAIIIHPPPTPHNEVVEGYIGFTPSVCPSVPHPVSALWRLQFWMDPFYFYFIISNFDFFIFFKINFHFVFFWLGIRCESLVLVVMGRRGVSQNEGVLVVLVWSMHMIVEIVDLMWLLETFQSPWLTHCCLVILHGIINLIHHSASGLLPNQHQAIARTNADTQPLKLLGKIRFEYGFDFFHKMQLNILFSNW